MSNFKNQEIKNQHRLIDKLEAEIKKLKNELVEANKKKCDDTVLIHYTIKRFKVHEIQTYCLAMNKVAELEFKNRELKQRIAELEQSNERN